jgi:nucleoside-diphosphate-sugar epimerase
MVDNVLLTGISGFLGGHVARALLDAGYRVRGSVRNLDKADKVRATLDRAGADISRLEFVALDLLSDTGWAEAMAGMRYLQHTASPFVINMPADKMDLIRPAVEGTRRALNAALKANVERIVVTSSMAAASYGHEHGRTAPYGAADWTNPDGPGVNAYIESKVRAEKEAWAIMDRADRHSDLATINPNGILGPLLDDDPGTSAALVLRLLDGTIPMTPRIYFTVIDVRDVAEAHVAAMTSRAAGGHRFPMGMGTLSLHDISGVVRHALPQFARKIPRLQAPDWLVRVTAMFDRDMRGNIGELGVMRPTDPSEVVKLLGHPLISAEDAIVATAKSLVEQGLARP